MVKVQLPSQLDVTTGEELTAEWENETHRGHLAKLRFYFFYHPQESWEAFDGPNFDDAQAFDSLFFFILPLFWCYWHNSCSTTQVHFSQFSEQLSCKGRLYIEVWKQDKRDIVVIKTAPRTHMCTYTIVKDMCVGAQHGGKDKNTTAKAWLIFICIFPFS
ncbi:hypothetical protein OUZ56_018889 [Daphnia magna]|uniref:Uncharacterized protein n=1 Tax=Daphnia magna TaxID=35525 RepID=A0ABQ9ZA22_9CRUS|nr:hypothetical protein OUZ56_018889 [Daphnia magna]